MCLASRSSLDLCRIFRTYNCSQNFFKLFKLIQYVYKIKDDEDSENTERKSKEQLEAEKRAILQQRIQPLEIDGFNENKLTDKAKELHKEIYRLEAEKYDLEKRFKEQQYDVSDNNQNLLLLVMGL